MPARSLRISSVQSSQLPLGILPLPSLLLRRISLLGLQSKKRVMRMKSKLRIPSSPQLKNRLPSPLARESQKRLNKTRQPPPYKWLIPKKTPTGGKRRAKTLIMTTSTSLSKFLLRQPLLMRTLQRRLSLLERRRPRPRHRLKKPSSPRRSFKRRLKSRTARRPKWKPNWPLLSQRSRSARTSQTGLRPN